MPHTQISLPAGDLGMELAPAVYRGTCSQGCVIKAWQRNPKVKEITLGSKIISVDGEYVESLSFSETVERIRNSKSRVVLLESPVKVSQSKENASPNVSWSGGTPPNRTPKKKMPLFVPPPSQVMRQSPSETPNTTITRLRQERRQQDGIVTMLQGQRAAAQQQLSTTRDEVKRLGAELQSVGGELASVRGEALVAKGEKRDCDGQILLLKYQLDRIKRQHSKLIPFEGEDRSREQIVGEAREKEAWLAHWSKYRGVLQAISNSPGDSAGRAAPAMTLPEPLVEATSAAIKVTVDSCQQCEPTPQNEVEYELMVQQRLSHRLELQLRCWVDGQIELHKRLAAEEGMADFQKQQELNKGRSMSSDSTSSVPLQPFVEAGSRRSEQSLMLDSRSDPRCAASNAPPRTEASRVGGVSRQYGYESNHQRQQHSTPMQPTGSAAPISLQPSARQDWRRPSSTACTASNRTAERHDSWRMSPLLESRGTPSEAVPNVKASPLSSSSPVLSPQLYRHIQSSLPETHSGSTLRTHRASGAPHTSTQQSTTSGNQVPIAARTTVGVGGDVTTLRSRSLKSTALREQMRRLKEESASIRGDLTKFRSTIREVREECGTSRISR